MVCWILVLAFIGAVPGSLLGDKHRVLSSHGSNDRTIQDVINRLEGIESGSFFEKMKGNRVRFGSVIHVKGKVGTDPFQVKKWLSSSTKVFQTLYSYTDQDKMDETNGIFEFTWAQPQRLLTFQLTPKVLGNYHCVVQESEEDSTLRQSIGVTCKETGVFGKGQDMRINSVATLTEDGEGGVEGTIVYEITGRVPKALQMLPRSVWEAGLAKMHIKGHRGITSGFESRAQQSCEAFKLRP